jgi:hypothetical protein
VDTYYTLKSGVPNAIRVFREMKEAGIHPKSYGIRLDSGDLAYLSKKARVMLDAAGFEDAVIAASNPAGPVPMIAISYRSISTSIPVINTLFQNILFLHCDNKHLFILSQIKLCAIFLINRLYTIYFLLSI